MFELSEYTNYFLTMDFKEFIEFFFASILTLAIIAAIFFNYKLGKHKRLLHAIYLLFFSVFLN
ncbi:MAG: hypothetical protein COA95_04990 [Methylophaga sp.]|nr:MAG: hypothetical protein COA95_04990 [Methylophaga sp.]